MRQSGVPGWLLQWRLLDAAPLGLGWGMVLGYLDITSVYLSGRAPQ